MALKSGLWLTYMDETGEATPAECKIVEQHPERWVLDAVIAPQVYPVTFVAARLRLDGEFLGSLRFAEPITTVTHQPKELRLEFPVNEAAAGALLKKR